MSRFYSGPLLIFMVAVCICLCDCGGDKSTDDVWRFLSGVVRDSVTGMPIDSAWIDINDTIAPFTTRTDTVGMYVIAFGTTRYSMQLFVGKEEYMIKDTSIMLPEGQINIDSVNIYLKPEKIISN